MRAFATALATSLALAPLVAACASSDTIGRTAMATTASPTLAEAVPAGAALATLPRDAGAVVAVVQTRRSNGIDQKITLVGDAAGSGANVIDVSSRDHDPENPVERVDEASIEAEMTERLPGIAMTIAPRLVVSASGPVGVATGHTATGAGCLYAWSNGGARSRAVTVSRLLGLDGPDNADLRVRIRLCRQGASDESLIALAEGLRLDPTAASSITPGRQTRVATGGDALESAGYGAPAAVTPALPARAKAPAVPVVAHAPTHATPAPAKAAAAITSAKTGSPSPRTSTIVATPIPLPTGG